MVEFNPVGSVLFIIVNIVQVTLFSILIGKFFHTDPFKKIYNYFMKISYGTPFFLYIVFSNVVYGFMMIGYFCGAKELAALGMFIYTMLIGLLLIALCIFFIVNIVGWMQRLHNYIGMRKGQ